jgi:hypothetical protein
MAMSSDRHSGKGGHYRFWGWIAMFGVGRLREAIMSGFCEGFQPAKIDLPKMLLSEPKIPLRKEEVRRENMTEIPSRYFRFLAKPVRWGLWPAASLQSALFSASSVQAASY